MNPVNWLLCSLLVFQVFEFEISVALLDTISVNQSIKDGDVLVSTGKFFALGFFSPGNSVNRYVGIWYYQIPEQTVVWVANRDRPINGTSGVLSINGQGNLRLYDGNQSSVPVWSTNVSVSNLGNTVAQLLDTGNLVLLQNGDKRVIWESFDYPTDTMLPFMKIGLDLNTGFDRFLTTWRSSGDPGIGNYSFRIDPTGFPQLSMYKGSDKWWRAGSWTGERWSGIPEMAHNFIFKTTFVNNQSEVSVVTNLTDLTVFTRLMVNESGLTERFTWNSRENRWIGFWSVPKEDCDYYHHCGMNSNCNPYRPGVFECECLPGFEPQFPREWFLRDGSSGCKRKTGMSVCQPGEGFVKVTRVKVPDTSVTRVDLSLDLKGCGLKCLSDCSCVAYTGAYPEGSGVVGCLTYHGNMTDTRTFTNAGQDLCVRVDAAELALYAKKGSIGKNGIVGMVIASFAILIVVALSYWFIKSKRKGMLSKSNITYGLRNSTFLEEPLSGHDQHGEKRNTEVALFDMSTIATATDNFLLENKLGEGGFGSVYKGVLPNGREIAIKRLSKNSSQGIEEFKNEVSLIAKLQHRNLVTILGYCIEGEEKMLVYEFVPNKSLDFFLFDPLKKYTLDWNKRYEIICGIARGILYLHQDSRLRIIHRDLKASNVLLDKELNPKIADFGMARIFGGDQMEGNTKRVVGTYGYMAPEYAMEGLFSIKSDVYSFGVLLVEIITSKKNSGFHLEDCDSVNLIGHVWNLWKERRAKEIIDKSMGESYPINEVSRCIQIGLLCVQEQATDRPNMSSVVLMLSNDNPLPSPNQPAFIAKRNHHKNQEDTGTTTDGASSINDVTISVVTGR